MFYIDDSTVNFLWMAFPSFHKTGTGPQANRDCRVLDESLNIRFWCRTGDSNLSEIQFNLLAICETVRSAVNHLMNNFWLYANHLFSERILCALNSDLGAHCGSSIIDALICRFWSLSKSLTVLSSFLSVLSFYHKLFTRSFFVKFPGVPFKESLSSKTWNKTLQESSLPNSSHNKKGIAARFWFIDIWMRSLRELLYDTWKSIL